jgi:predicted RNase H-like nuclease (RuvC/YqgF family)
MVRYVPKNYRCKNCGREQYSNEFCFGCHSKTEFEVLKTKETLLLCEHGNTFSCLQCEVKYLKYVIEEQQKEIAEWKEKEFRACSKHHEFIEEIEGLEADLKQANALLQWENDYSEKKHLKNIELAEKVEKIKELVNDEHLTKGETLDKISKLVNC